MTEQACIDDTCQIYALLGRELLGWDKGPPNVSQFAIFYRPEGDGYVEQCPWKALGITPLPPGEPDLDNMQYFTAPKYEDGGQTAGVSFVVKLVGRDPGGRPLPPYINQTELTLRKVDGRWTLVEQLQGSMP